MLSFKNTGVVHKYSILAIMLLSLSLLNGCYQTGDYIGGNRVWLDNASKVLSYDRFKFTRSKNYKYWYLLQSEQASNRAKFNRFLSPKSHQFFVIAKIWKLSKTPQNINEFFDLVLHRQKDIEGVKTIEFKKEIVKGKYWQIKYKIRLVDARKPYSVEEPYRVTLIGNIQIHPAHKDFVFEKYYSERGFKKDLDHKLYSKGEEILSNITLVNAKEGK